MALIGQMGLTQCPRDLNTASVPSTNNLILHLPFDNNLNNFGSDSFELKLSGPDFVPSNCNTGLEFDGIDDFLEISPSLSLINDFTITAWIKPFIQENRMGVFSIRDQCTTSYRGYSMAQFSINEYGVSGLNYQVNSHRNCTGYSGGDRYINPAILINNNEYTFVAVSVQNNSSENRKVTLFVNCMEYSTETTIDLSTSASFNPNINYKTTIGANSSINGYHHSFHGIIDEVRVYSEALDRVDLLDIYFDCLPLTLEVTGPDDCDQDSTFITLYNTEPDVKYHLIDDTNSQMHSMEIDGNCDSVEFGIGPLQEPTSFQIQAENLITNCITILDTTIQVLPYSEYIYVDNTFNLCEGDSALVQDKYIYSNHVFIDTISSISLCDTIIQNSYFFAPYPNINLGQDTTLCIGDTLTLNVSEAIGEYTWQDNSTNPTYDVIKSGTYSLLFENECGSSSDSIDVQFNECCNIQLPNVFSPNFDGINDNFIAIRNMESCDRVSSFSMKIFNKWGACVFESDDISHGWDGTFGGKVANAGVYVYIIEYSNGLQNEIIKGDVRLLK